MIRDNPVLALTPGEPAGIGPECTIRLAHEHPELISIFTTSLNFFESVWYGMYRIVRADFDVFDANHQRIIAFAQK